MTKTKEPSPKDREQTGPKGQDEPTVVPVVGIGASAGGLEALRSFFKAMLSDAGIAFVVVPHLDPNQKSLMAELLTKYTDMEVVQAENGMEIQPDHVYVIAPNTYLTIDNNELKVNEPVKVRGMRMPIDYFFRSLGETRQEKAICIVLSGTATDGTLGLRAVKSHGGLGLVQDPASATHDGMPRSAISTGMVDFVLPVEEMPSIIVRYVRHPFIRDAEKAMPQPEQARDDLQNILALLRHRARHDFRFYKKTTLMRRIQRRIGLNHLENYADYTTYLRNNPREVELLFKELLIGVTEWFRDKEAWATLKERVLPRLFDQVPSGHPLRFWVAGCATGEEAYSLAILLTEMADELEEDANFIIFATDVNGDSLEFARNGVYPDSIADEISQERLTRFFSKEGQSFRIKNTLREAIVFAQQNLISDPPFSRLDFISCRNLLIYLEPDIQKKIIAMYHFSLKPGGYLFLGNSENVTQQKNLFESVSKKWRIFKKIGLSQTNPNIPVTLDENRFQGLTAAGRSGPGGRRPKFADLARKILLDRFVPASVLVDASFQVLYYHGPHEKYLVQPPGEPTTDLLSIARDGLRPRLRGALNTVIKKQEELVFTDAKVKRGDSFQRVQVTVTPVQDRDYPDGLLLVTFEDTKPQERTAPQTQEYEAADETVVRQLEEELKFTKEELRSTIEELETSNEELKSSNEEVMSMNEELQSANEELETSKEELQSMNEELTTVNAQLEEKVKELESANNDLQNLLSSTDIATIFLDTNLRIKRYTPAIRKIFNYLPTDRGRPISDLSHHTLDPDLPRICRQVLDNLQPEKKEVRTEDGRWFIRRTLPYRTEDNRIEGVVVTFVDINDIKDAERELKRAKELAEAVNDLNELIHSTLEFTEIMAKVTAMAGKPLGMEAFSVGLVEGADYIFKYAHNMPEDFTNLKLSLADLQEIRASLRAREVVTLPDVAKDRRLALKEIKKYGIRAMMIAPLIIKGRVVGSLNFYCLTAPFTFTTLQIDYARKLADSVSLAMDNARLFEELRRAEQSARSHEELAHRRLAELQGIYASAPVGLCFVDTDLRYVKINERMAAFHCEDGEAHLGRTVREMVPELADIVEPSYRQVIETGTPLEGQEIHDPRTAGTEVEQDWLAGYYPVKDDRGRVLGVNTVMQDVSELKQAERQLADKEKLLRQVLDNMPVGVWIADEHGKIISGNPAGQGIWQGARYVPPEEFHTYKAWWLDSGKEVTAGDWAVTRAITRGETSLGEELEIEAFDGTHKIIDNSAIPLLDDEGNIMGAIAINIDITRQKRLEQELLRSNQELEQFAYVCSHDLKEPLRMVTSYVQLFQHRYEGKIDAKADKFIGFVVEGTSRMHELIEDLLTFSRIGNKGKPLSPTEMEKVFTKTVRYLKRSIEETGATIDHDQLPSVMGDEKQLIQLMQNLLSNALKFTADRQPEIRISVSSEDSLYRFAVEDNGIGVAPEHAERIFTIFQRLHSRSRYPGTGIGLAICKKIVAHHGGRIWVESKPGEGSIFSFTLKKA